MAVSLPSGGVFRYIALDQIRRRPDARPLDEDVVTSLAESILDVGLRNPINVRLVGDGYELVAGAHRLAAFARLGESEIPVQEFGDDDLHTELAMIDENLCRAELSPSDKARQTARRKAIYLELHPQAAHGGDRRSDQVAKLATRSFNAETASATGQSERAIRRDAERGQKIVAEALDLIRGTRLDTGAYLDRLKGLSPDNQLSAARSDLADGSSADRRPANSAETVADPARQHRDLIARLDAIGGIAPAEIIAGCPPRERAALCTRLSHLIDVFQQIMEGVAP